MNEVKIRRLEEADIPIAAKLMQAMWVEHGQKTRLIDEAKVSAADAEDYIKRHVAKGDVFYVAEADGGVVGTIYGEVEDLPRYYKYDKRLLIDNLSVSPDYRGRGIAGKLISACEEYASQNGIEVLAGEIWDFNDASRAAFGKMDYKPDMAFWYKVLD